jgi:hypothetical protein
MKYLIYSLLILLVSCGSKTRIKETIVYGEIITTNNHHPVVLDDNLIFYEDVLPDRGSVGRNFNNTAQLGGGEVGDILFIDRTPTTIINGRRGFNYMTWDPILGWNNIYYTGWNSWNFWHINYPNSWFVSFHWGWANPYYPVFTNNFWGWRNPYWNNWGWGGMGVNPYWNNWGWGGMGVNPYWNNWGWGGMGLNPYWNNWGGWNSWGWDRNFYNININNTYVSRNFNSRNINSGRNTVASGNRNTTQTNPTGRVSPAQRNANVVGSGQRTGEGRVSTRTDIRSGSQVGSNRTTRTGAEVPVVRSSRQISNNDNIRRYNANSPSRLNSQWVEIPSNTRSQANTTTSSRYNQNRNIGRDRQSTNQPNQRTTTSGSSGYNRQPQSGGYTPSSGRSTSPSSGYNRQPQSGGYTPSSGRSTSPSSGIIDNLNLVDIHQAVVEAQAQAVVIIDNNQAVVLDNLNLVDIHQVVVEAQAQVQAVVIIDNQLVNPDKVHPVVVEDMVVPSQPQGVGVEVNQFADSSVVPGKKYKL